MTARAWQPIETAPRDKRILLWWTPITPNKPAETVIVGEVSSYEPGCYYHGQDHSVMGSKIGYGPLKLITHWMPLPEAP
jgi:hypothetical protein